ncbi:MAG: 4Fe-4S ferredoxin, partial [Burkholderiales bacterium]|nr:4Fe-4S ferredoxin [Burkholderiales bacterium]
MGFVELARDTLTSQRDSVLRALPWVRSFVVFVRRLNRHAIRVPLRGSSSAEFIAGGHDVKAIIHRVGRELEIEGVRAVGISGLFPMEIGRQDGSPFVVSLKHLAEAAGLGVMGKNRLVLHPNFGADIQLGAIAIDRPLTAYDKPLESSPCLDCNLCVVTCPTGAIAKDGHFDYGSCMTH